MKNRIECRISGMRRFYKNIFGFVLLGVFAFASFSCGGSGSNGGSDGGGLTTPSLSYQNYRTYYGVGMENKNDGNLTYKSSTGVIETVENSLSNAGVTVTGFDTSAAGLSKTMTIAYKGATCSAEYNVYNLDDVSISGSYIVADDTVYDVNIATNAGNITCKKYDNWGKYLENDFASTPVTFERDVNPSGNTVVRASAGDDLRITLYPDGQGGIREVTYKKISDFVKPASNEYYVSSEQERSNSEHGGEYMIARFDDNYNLSIWFKADDSTDNLAATPDDTISNVNLHFGTIGFFYSGKNISNQHEFKMRESSSSTAWDSIVATSMSDSEASWKGYSYTIRLKKD